MPSRVTKMDRDDLSLNDTQTKPSPEPWSLYKETIIDLYIVQNRSLKDVTRIMAKQHGFSARYNLYLPLVLTASLCNETQTSRRGTDRLLVDANTKTNSRNGESART